MSASATSAMTFNNATTTALSIASGSSMTITGSFAVNYTFGALNSAAISGTAAFSAAVSEGSKLYC